MMFKPMKKLAFVVLALCFILPTSAQQGRWAAASDQTAKYLIDMERQWAESGCTHSGIMQTILADDFQGTAPNGSRYSKSEAIEREKTSNLQFRECHLNDAKVHFFSDNIAIVYGSEGAIRKTPDEQEHTGILIWTDTWLKRHGRWQIVAAQDMPADTK
jgi:hypothetical protein